MYTNPLRVLDSKNQGVQTLLNDAPELFDYLDVESREHFDGLCKLLDTAGIKYRVNQRLVRGLDYYNRTVFEWVTTALGSQGTVCAGIATILCRAIRRQSYPSCWFCHGYGTHGVASPRSESSIYRRHFSG